MEDIEDYQKRLMKSAKGTIGLGIMTVGGTRLIGGFGGALGPTTAPVVQSTTAALQLANIGNLAAVGMNLMPKESKKKATGNKQVDYILGI